MDGLLPPLAYELPRVVFFCNNITCETKSFTYDLIKIRFVFQSEYIFQDLADS